MTEEWKDLEQDVPTLTLDPGMLKEEKTKSQVLTEERQPEPMDESILSEEERKMVDAFAAQIDLTNTNQILQYGAGTQKKMADFSETALENVKTQDLGEVGELIAGVVNELKNFDAEEEKGFFGFFKKQSNRINSMKIRYEKAEVNVGKIVEALHDLELTRMISIQTAPQIRLVQNNDTVMVEKIQTTIVNTIPLWKSQMVLALGIAHSTEAARAQREVTDMTNELLRKNAQTLQMATVETAKEAERGIVDMETLKNTNDSLIHTLDEVMRIQQEGREKRRQAEIEIRQMEDELKKKLLEIR